VPWCHDGGMELSDEAVIAASNAWIWIPDTATATETDDYLIVRFPDYFDHPLEVIRFTPAGPVADAVEMALGRAREYGLPKLWWAVRLDSPPGVGELLAARGATVDETLDVLARDLSGGAPELPPPATEAELRWAADTATMRDGLAVGAEVFGGSMTPDDRIETEAKRAAADIPAGKGGTVVAYAGGVPAAVGGVTVTDEGVARLWLGAVLESARGQGLYRAVLAARLTYAARHGATMALVKARTRTSGPILRRAGFAAYGQELIYEVPLG
jgi:GNAT superfamily N-acetyltransferase